MFKKFAVSAVAVALLAASAVSAQGTGVVEGQWPCGAHESAALEEETNLTCTGHQNIQTGQYTLIIAGLGPMKDYAGSMAGGTTAPWGNKMVSHVIIENGVTYIGAFTFMGVLAQNLEVTISAGNPPTVGNDAFGANRLPNYILRVPQASIDAYRTADVWKDFGYINPSTVKFNSVGTVVDSQLVTYGGKVTKPADPTREGYVFDSWYREVSGTNPYWNFETDTVTHDITLYAAWTNTSSVAHGVRPSSAAASRVTVRNNTLTVRPSSPESVSRVQLIDMRGKSVASFTARGAGSFSLGNIPAGRYFVEVREGARRERGSVVVGVR